MKMLASAVGTLLVVAASSASAQLAKQLTIEPGKGISFFMGTQQGTAIFKASAGNCELTVTIASAAQAGGGMSGMAGGMSGMQGAKAPAVTVHVMPARPARVDTPDGQQLVFNCGPDAKLMFLDMPSDFKYTSK